MLKISPGSFCSPSPLVFLFYFFFISLFYFAFYFSGRFAANDLVNPVKNSRTERINEMNGKENSFANFDLDAAHKVLRRGGEIVPLLLKAVELLIVLLKNRVEDTANSEAYLFYLKSRYFWNKRTAEWMKKGIECFNESEV